MLVSLATNEDAGVYRISDDLALVQTLDFFTPIVDDPFTFGKISAANSLSDVYAMGGKPLTAMNIVCFPSNLPLEILAEILKGGAEKIIESGAVMVGGHSVKDNEPKYGLSVTGLIHPERIIINSNLQENDILILTKPLGTGIISTALKRKRITEEMIQDAIKGMETLNKTASESMLKFPVNACTDITGYGFIGHLNEMCKGSGKGAEIYFDNFKFYNHAVKFAFENVVPGGCKDNLKNAEEFTEFSDNIELAEKYLLSDPQTSGGLLISLPEEFAVDLLELLLKHGLTAFIAGKVINEAVIKVKK